MAIKIQELNLMLNMQLQLIILRKQKKTIKKTKLIYKAIVLISFIMMKIQTILINIIKDQYIEQIIGQAIILIEVNTR